ncbi:MAG: hypothetical protein US62_C0015G0023 [Candidatus Woesebacteria bacterium GW2011_GWA1_37_8]|uniref:Sortase family protein n=2 Tax=Candidatus Woeseibacteriota TaxID=1752722 RepID=A0A0G0LI99_9BACT|nr:MAG: hypothetical protein US39_C0005G0032 [Microgenomates group bacterium GW2011_GWC1_37_12b]KKQ45442.1 MAG: hypothetical protein US62_C0015G0023 [Candidatus Woesebacteria bacterium GW2011_GWA1_37_8]KKQ87645.1 MAG: hypothetical protein UT10_C0003G0049 [Candidatus Woesebacteria bacterium GW2011_GWB1_38_8b]
MATANRLFQFVFVLFFGTIVLFIILYFPIIGAEIKYTLARKDDVTVIMRGNPIEGLRRTIVANDTDFGIIIPKIGINMSVVANVNPYESYYYKPALKKGVAHSKGSAFPGKGGNIIIFSHVPGGLFEVQKYNLAFYLINRLEIGDPIFIYFDGLKYQYNVTGKNVVSDLDVKFEDLSVSPKTELLTIMTLWPPGTSLRRYVIDAKKV